MGLCASSEEVEPRRAAPQQGRGGGQNASQYQRNGAGQAAQANGGPRSGAGAVHGTGILRPLEPWDNPSGPIAQSVLIRQRQEFWESRVTGAKIVWDNLKVVCDSLLNDPPEYESASAILEAAYLRVPQGTLNEVYDARGRRYDLPPFVWSTPRNAMSDEEVARQEAAKRKKFIGPVKPLKLLARLSTTDTKQEQTIEVTVKNNSTAAELKQAIHEFLKTGQADKGKAERSVNVWAPEGLPPAMQRVFFMGREIGEHDHMQGAKVSEGFVVQVFIAQGARAVAGAGGAAAAAGGAGS